MRPRPNVLCMKYFCACVRTCTTDRVLTILAMDLHPATLGPFTGIAPYSCRPFKKKACSCFVHLPELYGGSLLLQGTVVSVDLGGCSSDWLLFEDDDDDNDALGKGEDAHQTDISLLHRTDGTLSGKVAPRGACNVKSAELSSEAPCFTREPWRSSLMRCFTPPCDFMPVEMREEVAHSYLPRLLRGSYGAVVCSRAKADHDNEMVFCFDDVHEKAVFSNGK
jgi:hypothetical protein